MRKSGILRAETRSTASHRQMSPVETAVPALTILAHPESGRVGELATLPGLGAGEEVPLSRVEPDFGTQGSTPTGPLSARHLSRRPLVLRRGSEPGEVVIDRAGSRTRADVDGERLEQERRLSATDLERGVVLVLGRRVVLLFHLHPPLTSPVPDFGLVGASSAMAQLRRTVQAIADLRVPVLLRGESGTGKELLARAIHDAGPRRAGAYLAVNVAAVPPSLAAAELFGAARGAYTGADRRRSGFFQRADRGTLFLDEVGETPPEIQPLLLRVLENGEVQPVGGGEIRRVDVRVVAATDADLEAMVAAGRFSKPLFHRLAGYEIRVPPLRERRADLGRLLYHFLRRELAEVGLDDALDAGGEDHPWPPAETIARLALRDWPGNVRELKNMARRLVIELRSGVPALAGDGAGSAFSAGGPTAENAPADFPGAVAPPAGHWRPAYRRASEVGEDELLEALRDHRFELKPTAEALRLSRGTLYNLVAACPRVRKAADLERGEIEAALAATGGDLEAAAAALEVSLPGLKRRRKILGPS